MKVKNAGPCLPASPPLYESPCLRFEGGVVRGDMVGGGRDEGFLSRTVGLREHMVQRSTLQFVKRLERVNILVCVPGRVFICASDFVNHKVT